MTCKLVLVETRNKMSSIKSTSKVKFQKSLSENETSQKSLVSFTSTVPISKKQNPTVNITEPVFYFNGGFLSFTLPNLPIGSAARTIEFLVKYNGTPIGDQWAALQYGGASSNSDFCVVVHNTATYVDLFNATPAAFSGFSTFGYGEWHHVCITATTLSQKIYVNGNLLATGGFAMTTSSSDVNIAKRATASSSFTGGAIKEVRIWNKELSANQVGDLVRTRLEYVPSGLIFYSKINATTASQNIDSTGNVATISSSGTINITEETLSLTSRSSSEYL